MPSVPLSQHAVHRELRDRELRASSSLLVFFSYRGQIAKMIVPSKFGYAT